jgi:hypothetical protein
MTLQPFPSARRRWGRFPNLLLVAICLGLAAALWTIRSGALDMVFHSSRGAISATGGNVARLNFAIVGDTRPAKIDDTAGYPSTISETIYGDIEALDPRPDFAITTGDYMYVTPGKGLASAQAALYVKAAHTFSGQVFPAMGNHECTGRTNSNCGPSGKDGVTENYNVFLTDILGGFGIETTVPYYAVEIDSSDASHPWTSKFVFAAANAWDDAQASWLEAALSKPTTYTFVVRHEPDFDNADCEGCADSDKIIKAHPYTLLVVGHTHTYEYIAPNEILVGNGGAPLGKKTDVYGFVSCRQQDDDAIRCQEHDYQSPATSSYKNATVTVSADGTAKTAP